MDTFAPDRRSWIMSRVMSANTRPEVKVRSLLHGMGYRFRLHSKDLAGTPDIVLPKHRTAIFVHGCFWHRHRNCKRASTPSSNREYWIPKFERTKLRDKRNRLKLRRDGWRVIVVWECELRNPAKLAKRLGAEIGARL